MVRHTATRRQIMQAAAALLSPWRSRPLPGAESRVKNSDVLYGQATLPSGIRSRRIDTHNGITLHCLEAGFQRPENPCILLVHGFPELAYSWRHQLLPLAEAGFHAVAPDLRGYGRSTARPVAFNDDLRPYTMLNRVTDMLSLVRALGYENVACIAGHDWGGPTAQWCARTRPDVFHSVVSMSTPFFGAPAAPVRAHADNESEDESSKLDRALAALLRPRKHYARYSATREANDNMWHAPQGIHDFLRALYFFKSADFDADPPHPLKSWSASELAQMPTYYIMERDQGMAQTVAAHMPSAVQAAACRWLTEDDLGVYADEFTRTGFQGGLNYYRINEDERFDRELLAWSGRKIDVPALYLGGKREWAAYQSPGAFEAMHAACRRLIGVHLIPGAGHSVAEEQPRQVSKLLLEFMRRTSAA